MIMGRGPRADPPQLQVSLLFGSKALTLSYDKVLHSAMENNNNYEMMLFENSFTSEDKYGGGLMCP